MNIPTEYYEDEFIEFEEKCQVTCRKQLQRMDPDKRSQYIIKKYNSSKSNIDKAKDVTGHIPVDIESVITWFFFQSFYFN